MYTKQSNQTIKEIENLDYELIKELNSNQIRVIDFCVIKDVVFLAQRVWTSNGNHINITMHNLTTNKDDIIYVTDIHKSICSMTDFQIDGHDYIIFNLASTTRYQIKTDGGWKDAQRHHNHSHLSTRYLSDENGKIVLLNVHTRQEMIIADNLKTRQFITSDIGNKRIFVATSDWHWPKKCYKYSCEFVSYLDILKQCEMIKQTNLDSSLISISMIIMDMLEDPYYFKKTYLSRKEGAGSLYYDSVKNRLYFGKSPRMGHPIYGALKYLDLNQEADTYQTYECSQNIGYLRGLTGDFNGNIYVAGPLSGRGSQFKGINMFKLRDDGSLDTKDYKCIIRGGLEMMCCRFNEYDQCIYFFTDQDIFARVNTKHLL